MFCFIDVLVTESEDREEVRAFLAHNQPLFRFKRLSTKSKQILFRNGVKSRMKKRIVWPELRLLSLCITWGGRRFFGEIQKLYINCRASSKSTF